MLAELQRIAREVWPFVAGVLLGLAIGGVWTLLQPDRYRAETHLMLSGPPATRLAPAALTLANGSVVQENVKQTLRLSNPPDLSASLHQSILDIVAKTGSKERARQVVEALGRAGIRVSRDNVLSLSYMAPIACNDTDAGMAKNRRVEVWIAK